MTQELRKLAEAATQGPWNKFGNARGWSASHDGIGSSEYRPIKDDLGNVIALVVAQSEEHWVKLDTHSNAAYIAAANPAAILALLDRLEKAEKDVKRLDWVIRNRDMRVQGDDHRGWNVMDCSDGLTFVVREEGSFRSAIDSAMEASK